MKRIFSIFSILTLIGLLAGCHPIYKTEYAFVAPKSNVAKMCTAQCIQGKSSCEQMCRMNNESCRARAHQQAVEEFRQYKHDRKREHKEVKRNVSDFEHTSSCNQDCDCEPNYRACYSACGGQVLERDVCVAFCDKK